MTIALFDNIKSTYLRHKKSDPHALLMIREGDTFTAYYKDAESIAKVFNIRPFYDLGRPELPINNDKMDYVLPRLVKAGYKIAIVETTKTLNKN